MSRSHRSPLTVLLAALLTLSCSDENADPAPTGGAGGSVGVGGATTSGTGGTAGTGGSGGSHGTAPPTVSSVEGELSHQATLVVSGAGFGSKEPAAPLMWDDCEAGVVDSDAAVTSKGWVDVWPVLSGAPLESHRTRYRSVPHRSTPAPHPRSEHYLAGGHYQYPNNDPPYIGDGSGSYRNVSVTADSGAADKSRWFATWYYRLDPLWRSDCPSYNNHKVDVVQTGSMAYTPSGEFAYTSYGASQSPACVADNACQIGVDHHSGECGGVNPYPPSDNPRLDWIRYEHRSRSDDLVGFRRIRINNELVAYLQADNCPAWLNDSRSFSVGGYYRSGSDINDISTYEGCADCFRYFDDIYVDHTFARVMLADAQDYEAAVVVEPQIPSAWSDASITATVNLGALTGPTVYLFVFDADGGHNPVGFPLDL